MKKTVICFVFDQPLNRLLMILKKKGQGTGKWNMPGGKLQVDESHTQAAVRETQEETGITPVNPSPIGILEFFFPAGNNWDNECTVFVTDAFTGQLQPEVDECSAHWVQIDKIPLDKMWESDRAWLPLVLAKKSFHRAYYFDEQDRVIEEKIFF